MPVFKKRKQNDSNRYNIRPILNFNAPLLDDQIYDSILDSLQDKLWNNIRMKLWSHLRAIE